MSEKYGVAYNTGNDPLPYDEDGHMLAPRDWAAVRRSEVADHIASGAFVWVDPNTISHMSNPNAWEAKQKYWELTQAWENEKAGATTDDVPDGKPVPPPTDYDDSDKNSTVSSKSKRR